MDHTEEWLKLHRLLRGYEAEIQKLRAGQPRGNLEGERLGDQTGRRALLREARVWALAEIRQLQRLHPDLKPPIA